MKTKSVILLSIGLVLATLKVCHKVGDRLNGLPMPSAEEEDKTKTMSSHEIKKYIQGSWKARDDRIPDLKIEIQGETIIFTQGESQKKLTMENVANGQFGCPVPEFYLICFKNSKDTITIYRTSEGGESNDDPDFYDRVGN